MRQEDFLVLKFKVRYGIEGNICMGRDLRELEENWVKGRSFEKVIPGAESLEEIALEMELRGLWREEEKGENCAKMTHYGL